MKFLSRIFKRDYPEYEPSNKEVNINGKTFRSASEFVEFVLSKCRGVEYYQFYHITGRDSKSFYLAIRDHFDVKIVYYLYTALKEHFDIRIRKLEVLDVDLEEIPEGYLENIYVEDLYFHYTKLKKFPKLPPQLQIFNFRENQIEDFPKDYVKNSWPSEILCGLNPGYNVWDIQVLETPGKNRTRSKTTVNP